MTGKKRLNLSVRRHSNTMIDNTRVYQKVKLKMTMLMLKIKVITVIRYLPRAKAPLKSIN